MPAVFAGCALSDQSCCCRQLLVQWTTRDPGTPTVRYGTESGQHTETATGATHTYSAADMCGSPANDTAYVAPGSLQIVSLDNLTESTQYFFIYGDSVRRLTVKLTAAHQRCTMLHGNLTSGSTLPLCMSPAIMLCAFSHMLCFHRSREHCLQTLRSCEACDGPALHVCQSYQHNSMLSRLHIHSNVQDFGFSQESSFATAEPVGASSTIHILATADLGHTTLDGAIEYDYDESEDPLNFSPTGTVTQVRFLMTLSRSSMYPWQPITSYRAPRLSVGLYEKYGSS